MTAIPIAVVVLGTVHKDLEKKTGIIGNQRKGRDHQDYRIIKIGTNTE